jgi:hypothetical protein
MRVCTASTCVSPRPFMCGSGECISGDWVCNGRRDCVDGRDEHLCAGVCPPTDTRCDSGQCVHGTRARCDGVRDCPDGSDEWACGVYGCTPEHSNSMQSSSTPTHTLYSGITLKRVHTCPCALTDGRTRIANTCATRSECGSVNTTHFYTNLQAADHCYSRTPCQHIILPLPRRRPG